MDNQNNNEVKALENYLSYTKHELRNHLGILREGVSQVLDGLGEGDWEACFNILKPALKHADELNSLIDKLLSASAFNAVLKSQEYTDKNLNLQTGGH